jgi:nucleoside diphosphate kinase
MTISDAMARQLCQADSDNSNFEEVIESYTKGPNYLIVLEKGSAINAWKELIGPTSPAVAKERAPES